MKEAIEEAIKALAERAHSADAASIGAQQYAQAVLSLTQALLNVASLK